VYCSQRKSLESTENLQLSIAVERIYLVTILYICRYTYGLIIHILCGSVFEGSYSHVRARFLNQHLEKSVIVQLTVPQSSVLERSGCVAISASSSVYSGLIPSSIKSLSSLTTIPRSSFRQNVTRELSLNIF
jgi:hypothetical protein